MQKKCIPLIKATVLYNVNCECLSMKGVLCYASCKMMVAISSTSRWPSNEDRWVKELRSSVPALASSPPPPLASGHEKAKRSKSAMANNARTLQRARILSAVPLTRKRSAAMKMTIHCTHFLLFFDMIWNCIPSICRLSALLCMYDLRNVSPT